MNKSKYQIQVNSSHYKFGEYVSIERWGSYYCQIIEVEKLARLINRNSLTILEIGPGNRIVTSVLKQLGHKVKTYDFDAKLKPDYVGSLPDLKGIGKTKFDCVICCQVLEHINMIDVGKALKNISNITNYAILSVPNRGFSISITIKTWIYKPLNWFMSIPTQLIPFKPNGEHKWELGSKDTNLEWIKGLITKAGFTHIKNYRLRTYPYHHFIVVNNLKNDVK